MKIAQEHYNLLEQKITEFCKANQEWFTEQAELLTDTALGWRAATLSGCIPFICDKLYSYLNDDHITTALKAILRQLRKEQI